MPSEGRYRHYKFTEDQFLKAIDGSGGFVTEIARRLGCNRSTVYAYKKRFPAVAKAIDDEKEMILDTAESALLTQIGKGNIAAIIFFLKTQGRSRGYNERQHLDISGSVETKEKRENDEKKDAAYVSKVMAELDKLGLKPSEPKKDENASVLAETQG